jgi:ATP-dependent DNA helicase RecQ
LNFYQQILTKYWGFSKFRPAQEDIIMSVVNGHDTLGLLPTGGGKSLTFQVPALAKEGICLVITPLISLMKDQVNRLKEKEIKALAIYSGMSRSEISIVLDNCIYGDFKFLYISPERIGTDLFRARAEKLNVNLIAVDEAHCISQWGYDFRPSYLKIADLRSFYPDATMLALTATATPDILEDIQEKLRFRKENVIRGSFERKNLVYQVFHTEDKQHRLIKILKNLEGSGIVYVRSRRRTHEIAQEIHRNKISVTYYHAGLDPDVRTQRQEAWTSGKTRIIVATNAFGMGIDKSSVRLVVHYEIPDSLESYYQEAGRAGRDGKTAYAILLYNNTDIRNMNRRVTTNFPVIKEIKRVYEAVGNYFQIPLGGGKGVAYDFDILDFAKRFKMSTINVYSSLKVLEREGYLELTEEIQSRSKVHFIVERDDLYKFQVANNQFDGFIKLLLRSYSGLFTEFVGISEQFLAGKANINIQLVTQYLIKLSQQKIIHYIPRKKTPFLVFTEERLDLKNLNISHANYIKRKEAFVLRQEKIQHYVGSGAKCRSQFLISYFGEKDAKRCGLCDVCKRRNQLGLSEYEFDLVVDELKDLLEGKSLRLEDIVDFMDMDEEKTVKVIRYLLDNDKIVYDINQRIKWNRKL